VDQVNLSLNLFNKICFRDCKKKKKNNLQNNSFLFIFVLFSPLSSTKKIKYLHFIGVDNLLLKPLDPLLLGLAAEDNKKKVIQKCVRMSSSSSNEDEDS